jgi:hypothetical protein
MASCGMLRCVDLVRTVVLEELRASIIKVTRIGELGTLGVTSNRRKLRRFLQDPLGVTSEDSILQESSCTLNIKEDVR